MKIAVIGAGISGLTFTAALRRLAPGIQVQLFERDLRPDSRFQGYSVGLRGDSGLNVLKSLGLYDQITTEAVMVKNFVFFDQAGKILLELPASGNRMLQRVKRQTLKTALLGAISDTPILQGMIAKGYREYDRGVEVQFENGQTAPADYLIACDGAASAIRRQMQGDQKHYLDLTSILFDTSQPIEHPLLDEGGFMTLGRNGTSVFCYRQTDGVHLSYTVHAASEIEISGLSAGTLLRLLQHETLAWHKPIPEIAAQVEPASVVVRGYYDKEPLKRVHQGRVWLIGDAAHPMSPFQGQGANMAMVDALKLAELFSKLAVNPRIGDRDAATLDRDIVRQGRRAILQSRNAARQFHTASHLEQWYRNLGFQMNNKFIRLALKN